MEYKLISLTQEKNICILKMDNPLSYNLLNSTFLNEFDNAIDKIFDNNDIKALILIGNEKGFCAGGDFKEMLNADFDTAKLLAIRVQKSFSALLSLDIPVIACLDKIVYGGGLELALHCDIRFCSDETQLRFPEVDMALIPGAGGITLFSKLFTKADAAYYLMSGEEIPLNIARKKGLIQNIYKKFDLLPETLKFAQELSKKEKSSLAAIKRILNANNFKSTQECLNMEIEEFSSALHFKGKDKIKDFLKKK
jgi:enoyl-CoA hydratase